MQEAGLSAKTSFIHETDGYYHIDLTDGCIARAFVWRRRNTGPSVKKPVEDLQPRTRLIAMGQRARYREFMATWAKMGGKKLTGDESIN
jgi:hypothetical protein